MKSYLLTAVILFSSYAQAQVTEEWVRYYAGPENNGDGSRFIALDNDNNIIVTGHSDVGNNLSNDIATIKYDQQGNQLWVGRFSRQSGSIEEVTGLAIDQLNNIFITGITYLDTVPNDYFTVKYTLQGTQEWVNYYNGTGGLSDAATDIAVDNSNNIIVTGRSHRQGGSDPDYDIYTVKYDNGGNELWSYRYNGPDNKDDLGVAVATDAGNNFYVLGTTNSASGDVIIFKYNSENSLQWTKTYDGPNGGGQGGVDLEIDNEGNVFVLASEIVFATNTYNILLLKYDSLGALEWEKRFNTAPNVSHTPKTLKIDSNGDVCIIGQAGVILLLKYSSTGDLLWNKSNSTNGGNLSSNLALDNQDNLYFTSSASGLIFAVKYDPQGNLIWTQTYSAGTGLGRAITLDGSDNIYVTGFFSSTAFAPADYVTIKYSQGGLAITNPAPGEKWIAGETDTIKWTGGQSARYVSIEYSTNSGATYIQITSDTPSDSNNYVWKIPKGILTTKAKIRITDVTYPEDSAVSEIFKIKGYRLTRISSSGNYDAFTKFRDPYAFGNDSAAVWPIEFWQNFDYTGTDPFTGYNYLLGFNALFLQAYSDDHPDWVSWVRTFGVYACYYNTTFPPVYSPTAVNRWFNNRDEWKGSCFGISHSNVLLFNHKTQFLNTYPSFPNVNPIQIVPDDSVLTVINELYSHQMGREHRIYRATVGLLKTPNQTLREIKAMLLDDDPLVRTLSIVSNDTTDPGGHSIMAYKVEQDTTLGNIFYVFTYDNSYPNNLDSAIIVVDTLANNNNGTWTPMYAWTNWGGTKWFYLREPAINYLVNPSLPKNHAAVSPFILGENELQILNTRKASISITDQQGNTSGYVNGILLNNIPGSIPNIIENGNSGPPIGYDLHTGNYSVKMDDYEEENAFINFYNSNKSFVVSRSAVQSSDNDSYYFDGGVSVTNPDGQLKNINLLNIVNETTQEKVFLINDIELAQADSVKIFNPDDNTLDLISYGSAKEYQLEVNLASASRLGRFLNNTIQLSQNTTHKLIPNWADLTNDLLTILVDEGNDGTIDDTLEIQNQITGIGAGQGSLLTPNSYNLTQNYPNPFNPITTINYSIPQRSNVTLKVYDVLGNEIAELINEEKDIGVYSVNFDASNLASGIYLYKIQAGSFVETKKMILLK